MTDAFKSHVMGLAQKARRSWKGAKHYNIFCTPKSGSTFIQNVISQYLDVQSVTYHDYDSGYRDVSINKVLEMADIDVVAKSHCGATHNAIAVMLVVGIPPVILSRNKRDTIASLIDHDISKDQIIYNIFKKNLDQEGREIVTICEWISWLSRFETTWRHFEFNRPLLFVDYDEIHIDKMGLFSKVLDYWGVRLDQNKLKKCIEKIENDAGKSNFNVGIQGRGKKLSKNASDIIDLYEG